MRGLAGSPSYPDEMCSAGRDVRQLSMFPEYQASTPLWRQDDQGVVRGVPLDNLPLPADLRRRLRRWCETFNHHYRWDSGWPSEATKPTPF